MPRIPIPFGEGLDRETGLMSVRPTSFEDLRNVLLHRGKIIMRRGYEVAAELEDDLGNPMTHVLAGQALKSLRVMIVVGYNQVNGEVHVFRLDSQAQTVTYIDEWTGTTNPVFPLSAGSAPPYISMDEAGGNVFMAHDSAILGSSPNWKREATFYYDGALETVEQLNADMGEGSEGMRFRGVVRHLDYLFGWGWYNSAEVDRHDVVVYSKAGLPLQFEAKRWIAVGDKGDPTILCARAGPPDASGRLVVFKEFETYKVHGYSHMTFGEFPLDTLHGIVGSRMAIGVGANLFFWSHEGPRLTDGSGPSVSLEIPLELPFPEPGTLVEPGELKDAFAEYLPVRRVVKFFFGRRVYNLTIRQEGDWKWSYDELGFTPFCGWRFPVIGSGLVSPPTAYATAVSSSNVTCCDADISWTNNSYDGDEQVELWAKPLGGSWERKNVYPIGGASQTETITDLLPGHTQSIQIRHRRAGLYHEDYQSSNPDDWPSQSATSFQTTLDIPSISDTGWERISATVERNEIQVDLATGHEGVSVEIWRGGTTLVHTEVNPTGPFTGYDTSPTGETYESYTVRHVTAELNGSFSGATQQWTGPPAPTISLLTALPDPGSYSVTWGKAYSGAISQVWDNWDDDFSPPVVSFPSDDMRYEGTATAEVVALGSGASTYNVTVGVRHKLTQFSVEDYSDFDTKDVTLN